jgi:hypothetical protein
MVNTAFREVKQQFYGKTPPTFLRDALLSRLESKNKSSNKGARQGVFLELIYDLEDVSIKVPPKRYMYFRS